jgi:hypothetical protein
VGGRTWDAASLCIKLQRAGGLAPKVQQNTRGGQLFGLHSTAAWEGACSARMAQIAPERAAQRAW